MSWDIPRCNSSDLDQSCGETPSAASSQSTPGVCCLFSRARTFYRWQHCSWISTIIEKNVLDTYSLNQGRQVFIAGNLVEVQLRTIICLINWARSREMSKELEYIGGCCFLPFQLGSIGCKHNVRWQHRMKDAPFWLMQHILNHEKCSRVSSGTSNAIHNWQSPITSLTAYAFNWWRKTKSRSLS